MIVGMKKVAVIMQAKDSAQGLKALRSFGMLHIENQQVPKSTNLNILLDDYALVQQGLEVLSEEEFIEHCQGDLRYKEVSDWKITCRHTLDLWKRIDHLEGYSLVLNREVKEWEKWGDFDPQAVAELLKRNIYCGLYKIPIKDFNNLSGDYVIKRIHLEDTIVYCAIISQIKPLLDFKEIELPKMSLSAMKNKLVENKLIIDRLQQELHQQLCFRGAFEKVKANLENEIEFENILSGMAQETKLSYLVGFAPHDCEKQLLDLSKKEKWGILITEPSEEDNVPVLIRNPKLIALINPVLKLLEILPGYRELDISLWFLLFFGVFFGMLIGDAGYGIVYFLLTAFSQVKFGKKIKDKSPFFLFYLLSFCAIIWGLLTGVFFGQEWLKEIGWKPLVPALNDAKVIQSFCFLLGAIHLSIAHIWRTILKIPSLLALAELGWIAILWGAYYLARFLILGYEFPFFGKWLIFSGIALVVLFTQPQKNILKAIGSGCGTLALNLMNNFTDIVSYVRLFAVGLAGVAIADTFNSMAAGVRGESILGLTLAIVVVSAGHLLNIVLGLMSVLVHGVRLNVLEFCAHVGISWSGSAYKPFKENYRATDK
ncbi:MAG: hypothetical protein HZC15_06450 [Candidatus Omnitrophica bacterium]|nr:hypothetical protein [Candidatus Omnitrophota bacterium]